MFSKIEEGCQIEWEAIIELLAEDFRRLTGVKKETFEEIVKVLHQLRADKKVRGGRPNKLVVEDTLLIALEYLREYRTYFHISKNYGMSERYTYKLIRWVEDMLIKSKLFRLLGRKALLKSDIEYEVFLVDASETLVQRPKRNKDISTLEKREGPP